ncbi:MAG: triacylglycerol lipase [Deltaproteobacteria bacterium]|jgi:pimeloyl-ACP methyl ester carboxylesterase|nr:triacylglycerol lipase [Deltaproteobacteria bacterium]MBW2535049.1 triacylglycerol lipase [Deltaproteobacteria bacterium]
MQHVYLVPGFFGFANLGDFHYFGHLRDLLEDKLRVAGIESQIERVHTHPTSSIRKRARRLLETIAATAGKGDAPIHLIGHSTGGLDARLLAAPHVDLGEGIDAEPIARRIRSVVTVASPHRGAPLAAFFASMLGQRLLQLLTLATVYGLRFGHPPLSFLLKLAAVLTRIDDVTGWRNTLVDQLFDQLLGEFTEDRRQEVEGFLSEVSNDQALLMQLTPDAMDLFNAGVTNRAGVRYGAVVTRSPSPAVLKRLAFGLDPYAQASYGLYEVIHRRTRTMARRAVDLPSGTARAAMQQALGEVPTESDSDGIVPTLSQPWGELIAAVEADHLDIIGHFGDPRHAPAHVDWLCSGSAFDRWRFEQVWRQVVEFMVR